MVNRYSYIQYIYSNYLLFWKVTMEAIHEKKLRKSNGFLFLCASVLVWLFKVFHFCLITGLEMKLYHFSDMFFKLMRNSDRFSSFNFEITYKILTIKDDDSNLCIIVIQPLVLLELHMFNLMSLPDFNGASCY